MRPAGSTCSCAVAAVAKVIPGSSRFYLSLRDDLMRIFAGEWVEKILKTWGGWQEGDMIESPMVTRRIEAAQKKVEERNFEIRKNLLEYDEVMDEQRKRVYSYRQAILDGVNCKDLILAMVEEQVQENLGKILEPSYSAGHLRRVGLQSTGDSTWNREIFAVSISPRPNVGPRGSGAVGRDAGPGCDRRESARGRRVRPIGIGMRLGDVRATVVGT